MEIVNTKKCGVSDERCKTCFLKTYSRLFEKFDISLEKRQDFIGFFHEAIQEYKHLSSPEIQRILNRYFCEINHLVDPFEEEKLANNTVALKLYKEWKPKVLLAINPFNLALRLVIAGNIMDYGANNSFDIEKTIQNVISSPLAIDDSEILSEKIKEAKTILYLGDNAGEIVFDKLFIETFMHNHVVYAVKASPILNDVTVKDAEFVGINQVADVISNGYNAPSTVLSHCSKEFMAVYNSVDLIISKGQGNFEGLAAQNDPRIFFVLMAKCDVVAELLHVKKGSFIVYNSKSL